MHLEACPRQEFILRHRFRIQPEPEMFWWTWGSPTYSIEPDPLTVAIRVSLDATTALPLPEMSILARLLLRLSPRNRPDPEILMSRSSAAPSAKTSPEPLTSIFILAFR